MYVTSGEKRLLTISAPNAPFCPRCGKSMIPAVREARVLPVPPSGATRPVTRPLQLAVWLCETCGIRRPRFA